MLSVYVSKKTEDQNIVDVSLRTGLSIFRPPVDYEKNVTEMSREKLKESYLSKMRLSYKKIRNYGIGFLARIQLFLVVIANWAIFVMLTIWQKIFSQS